MKKIRYVLLLLSTVFTLQSGRVCLTARKNSSFIRTVKFYGRAYFEYTTAKQRAFVLLVSNNKATYAYIERLPKLTEDKLQQIIKDTDPTAIDTSKAHKKLLNAHRSNKEKPYR